MNEAAGYAGLIGPGLKAAVGKRWMPAGYQATSTGSASSESPTRHIPRPVENVDDHRRRPGRPREPGAMQLEVRGKTSQVYS